VFLESHLSDNHIFLNGLELFVFFTFHISSLNFVKLDEKDRHLMQLMSCGFHENY